MAGNNSSNSHRLQRWLLLSDIYLIITLGVKMDMDPSLDTCDGQCSDHHILATGLCRVCHTSPINIRSRRLVAARAALPANQCRTVSIYVPSPDNQPAQTLIQQSRRTITLLILPGRMKFAKPALCTMSFCLLSVVVSAAPLGCVDQLQHYPDALLT